MRLSPIAVIRCRFFHPLHEYIENSIHLESCETTLFDCFLHEIYLLIAQIALGFDLLVVHMTGCCCATFDMTHVITQTRSFEDVHKQGEWLVNIFFP